MKGLTADIYRTFRDNDPMNVLNGKRGVTVIDNQICELNSPSEDQPAVKLVRRNIYGKPYIYAEPIEPGSYAFGGSFIFTSDSRLREVHPYPIPLHDRNMSLEVR